MPSALLIDYLERSRAEFRLVTHARAASAAALARVEELAGVQLAKAVLLRADAGLIMVVAPAPCRLSLQALRRALSARYLMLAPEHEFRRRFHRCEPGALPPFGHLFGLDSWRLQGFDPDSAVGCNAGSHTETLVMPCRSFQRLAHALPLELVPSQPATAETRRDSHPALHAVG